MASFGYNLPMPIPVFKPTLSAAVLSLAACALLVAQPPVPIGKSDLSEMLEVAASPQFSFDARSANLDHSFAVCLPLASRCGTRKSGPPPPGQRLEALCETSAEADAGRPSVVAHPTREFGVTGTRLLPSSNPKPSSPGIAK